MSRNVWVVLSVSSLFGLALGMYDLAFPYYLDRVGTSFPRMGYIFSSAALVMFLLRIYVGSISDRFGRKPFYSLSLLVGALSCFFTPLARRTGALLVLKSLRESSFVVKDTMHTVALYETARSRFMDFIARTNGAEFLSMGVGTMVGGLLLALGYRTTFWLSSGLVAAALFVLILGFREENFTPGEGFRLELGHFKLPAPLWLVTASGFMLISGMATSLCFVMPLFFAKKFGASHAAVAAVLTAHRISLGLPLMYVERFISDPSKWLYVASMAYEGLAIGLAGVIPDFGWATGVWLTHDLVGASIWLPIQKTWIQRFADPEARGRQVGLVLALTSLGWIVGPLLAGFSAGRSVSLPFVVSGIVVMLAPLPVLPLKVASIKQDRIHKEERWPRAR